MKFEWSVNIWVDVYINLHGFSYKYSKTQLTEAWSLRTVIACLTSLEVGSSRVQYSVSTVGFCASIIIILLTFPSWYQWLTCCNFIWEFSKSRGVKREEKEPIFAYFLLVVRKIQKLLDSRLFLLSHCSHWQRGMNHLSRL